MNLQEPIRQALESIRSQYPSKTTPTGGKLTDIQIDQFVVTTLEINDPLAHAARESIEDYRGQPDRRRNVIWTEGDPQLVAAIFNSKTAPNLGFEYFVISPIRISPAITELVDSYAMPVRLLAHSAGFNRERIVAVFPEEWRFIDSFANQLSPKAIYFIDRFVRRTKYTSLNLLASCTSTSSLRHLKQLLKRSAPDDNLLRLASEWMWVHEASHHKGQMPIPKYLTFKSGISPGAFEELRADAEAIVELIKMPDRTGDIVCLCEFILMERLLRYPVDCLRASETMDYDAIGSHVLLHFLENEGVVTRRGNMLDISEKWPDGLVSFVETIRSVELSALAILAKSSGGTIDERLSYSPVVKPVQKLFTEFVRRFVTFDRDLKQYIVDPYYQSAAAVAGQ